MALSSIPKLFQPIRVGTANLKHRVVLAPMTRGRAEPQHVPGRLIQEFYKQRTSVPGTLAITEGTFIAARAGGYNDIPGIWSDKQVIGWKSVRRLRSILVFFFCILLSLSSLFVTGRGCGARKRVVHLPPTLGTRAHRIPRRPADRRRVSTHRAEPNPTPNEK
jgi:hypothetical protein